MERYEFRYHPDAFLWLARAIANIEHEKTMPYKSKAQAAYFNIHKAELERQGVNVAEWNSASKGKKLPQRKRPPFKKSAGRRAF